MNTKQYIKNFLLEEVTSITGETFRKFDVMGFLFAFEDEFKQRIANERKLCNILQSDFTYAKFQNLVKQMDCKFNAVNNKAAGIDLSRDIFSKFFAQTVVPLRAEYFPEEHRKITEKRKERNQLEKA